MAAHVEWLVGLVRLGAVDYGDDYQGTFYLAGHGTHIMICGASGRPSTGEERRKVARECYANGFRTYEWERKGKRIVRGEIMPDGRLTIDRQEGEGQRGR